MSRSSRCTSMVGMVLALCLLAVGAQAERELERKDFSGWMEEYDSLVFDEQRNAFVFFNEAARGKYSKVLLKSVAVHSSDADTDGPIALEASSYLKDGLEKLLREKGVLAEAAGPGIAQLEVAITGVEKSKEDLKAYNFIPVAAVFRGAQAATGNVPSYIDTMFEGQMTDSESGERISAVVAKGIAETEKRSGDDLTFEDVKPTLDKWLAQYRQTLERLLN